MSMRDYIVHGALVLAFVLTLAAYVAIQITGKGVSGPIDEALLILVGAIAGATVPQARS